MKLFRSIYLFLYFMISTSFAQEYHYYTAPTLTGDGYSLFLIDTNNAEFTYERREDGSLISYKIFRDYFTRDNQLVKEIVQSFTGKESMQANECGYDYRVLIVKNGKLIEKLSVNLECGEILYQGKVYEFSPKILQEKIPAFHKMKRRFFEAKNLIDARTFWENYVIDKDEFIRDEALQPNWVKYDGFFTMYLPKKEFLRYATISQKLTSQLLTYEIPEDFSVVCYNTTLRNYPQIEYVCAIYSNKAFYDQLPLDKKGEWKEFSMKFHVFSPIIED